MGDGFYQIDAARGQARMQADISTVLAALADDSAWGVKTLRRAGMPQALLERQDAPCRAPRLLRGPAGSFLARCSLGSRMTLAYALKRGENGETWIRPSLPIFSSGRWLIAAGALALPGTLPFLALASLMRSLRVKQRSAAMLPAFCQILEETVRGRLREVSEPSDRG